MSDLPRDIDFESGFRLPPPRRENMNEEEKKIFDKILGPGNRTLAGIKGPLGINLLDPELAELESALNRYLRFGSGLSGRTRELAILVTAREMDSRFEWAAHEAEAIREGLEPEIVDIVKFRKKLAGLAETDAVVILLGREMFRKRKVTPETFAAALRIFGTKLLVNLVALMGYYSATAAKLCAFDNQVDPDKPVLPIP